MTHPRPTPVAAPSAAWWIGLLVLVALVAVLAGTTRSTLVLPLVAGAVTTTWLTAVSARGL